MKKRYISPTVKCIELDAWTLLAGSLSTQMYGGNLDITSTPDIGYGGDNDTGIGM